MKRVLKVELNGKVGYYRTVSRVSAASVKAEAERMYRWATVTVSETSLTPEEAASANRKLIETPAEKGKRCY